MGSAGGGEATNFDGGGEIAEACREAGDEARKEEEKARGWGGYGRGEKPGDE